MFHVHNKEVSVQSVAPNKTRIGHVLRYKLTPVWNVFVLLQNLCM